MTGSPEPSRPAEPGDALAARPASTVMLVRDAPAGLETFLMRRHAGMAFAAGMTVFPGGGVDDRDRDSGISWQGPPPAWWATRLGVGADLATALVCAAAREVFEESGVLLAGPAAEPGTVVADASDHAGARAAMVRHELSFADFLRAQRLTLRSDLLAPWANWVTPEEERTRRYDTFFFLAALPPGQRADGENSETDRASWTAPADALADFAAGRTLLLPPTWAQLDALAGRTVAEALTMERDVVAVHPRMRRGTGAGAAVGAGVKAGEFDFPDAERYDAARRAAELAVGRR